MTPTAEQLERLQHGVTIEWLKPVNERNYDNLVQNVDFIYVNQNKPCTRDDGDPVDFSGIVNGENMEWLIRKTGTPAGVDFRLYAENIVERPTNEKDVDWPNYNVFKSDYVKVKLSNDEIISSIRNMESDANAKVLAEAESIKANMLSHNVYDSIAKGDDMTEDPTYKRLKQINDIGLQNAANAESLIAVVNAGGMPNIDSNWITDTIVAVGSPYKL